MINITRDDTICSYDLTGGEPFEMFAAEVDALKALVHRLPPEPVIVQIGAGAGCSTLAMLEERPGAVILSIDIKPCEQETDNIKKSGFDHRRVIRLLGTSQDIGAGWPWLCHMLYVDGDHRRPGIDDDIRLWVPQVMTSGVIAFHDCYRPGTRPEHIKSQVYEAIEDWLERERHQELIWTNRLRGFGK